MAENLRGNLLSFKQNFMWLTGGLAGMLAATRWIIPEADLSPAVLIGILIGANIGAYMRNTSRSGREYDERDIENMEESMAWGFMAAITMLGLNLLNQFSFTSSEILLASSAVALAVTLGLEARQTGLREMIYSG